MVRTYFTNDEVKSMVTAVYLSKLSYGADIWHILGLSRCLHNSLKAASANASRLFAQNLTAFSIQNEIHEKAGRAWPMKMCQYRHALMMFKLFNSQLCEDEFVNMNF